MRRQAPTREDGRPAAAAAQPRAANPPSEADLAALWEGQRFPLAALITREGEPLRVIHRGRRQQGPGPDFRDATLVDSGGLRHGDVELHVRASDFRRHGHQADPAYQRLILHVVFWDDERRDTALADGQRVPVIALASWVARRAQELEAWLTGPPLWQEPCRTALARLGPQGVAVVLDEEGDRRFQGKVEAIARELERDDAQEVLYRHLLEALGYGGNREPFLALAHACPWRRLQSVLLAAGAGERRRMAAALISQAAASFSWRTEGLRPANQPQRRLAAAAALAARFACRGLVAGLMEAIEEGAEKGPQALQAALTLREGDVALIGSARAGEMAVNVVLPFAVAWGDPSLAAAAAALFRRWPQPSSYAVTRHLDEALLTGKGGSIALDARRQQGMLHLYKTWCRRGGCGRCPLS